jgi:hypothetical protein
MDFLTFMFPVHGANTARGGVPGFGCFEHILCHLGSYQA